MSVAEVQLTIEDAILSAGPPTRAEQIREYLDANPEIGAAFDREAIAVFRAGARHYSARTILHVLRHQSALQADPDRVWKVNNDLSPTLARDFLRRHPEIPENWFELRKSRTAKAPRV